MLPRSLLGPFVIIDLARAAVLDPSLLPCTPLQQMRLGCAIHVCASSDSEHPFALLKAGHPMETPKKKTPKFKLKMQISLIYRTFYRHFE